MGKSLSPEERSLRTKDAARLSAENKYRCGFCRQVKPIHDGIVCVYGGSVLFGLCPACHPGRPIVMRHGVDSQGNQGVFVGFLKESDHPTTPFVAPARDMADARPFTVNKFKKKEL